MDKRKSRKELVKALVSTNLTPEEHDELIEMLVDNPIAINVDKQEDSLMTTGDKLADAISAIVGSWPFIITFSLFLLVWVIVNSINILNALDPYPFILLNLLLSCIAALQAPIIMMSQNRQVKKDSLRNENDYLIDLKSELILEELHNKIEEIIQKQDAILKELKNKQDKN